MRRIRAFAPEVDVLLGSYNWNSARTLGELDAPYDDHVLYNFHFYEPHDFTHQGAYWEAPYRDVSARYTYAESGASEAWFEAFLAPAFEKAAREHCALYCGEFGVIERATPEDALKWYELICSCFEKHSIGRAAWSYKKMDFGLSDERMTPVIEKLLKLI